MHLTYINKNCIILNWIVMKPTGDRICEKGSYSLSDCIYLTVHCWTCEYGTNLKNLVTLHSKHGSIPESKFTSTG